MFFFTFALRCWQWLKVTYDSFKQNTFYISCLFHKASYDNITPSLCWCKIYSQRRGYFFPCFLFFQVILKFQKLVNTILKEYKSFFNIRFINFVFISVSILWLFLASWESHEKDCTYLFWKSSRDEAFVWRSLSLSPCRDGTKKVYQHFYRPVLFLMLSHFLYKLPVTPNSSFWVI